MKNTFKENLLRDTQEKATKNTLENTKEMNILETINEVNKTFRVERHADNDQVLGINGGELISKLFHINGKWTLVSGKDEQELQSELLKIANGETPTIITRNIFINGNKCGITGHNEEELARDELNARIFAKQHPDMFRDCLVAEEMAELPQESLPDKQIDCEGMTFFIKFATRNVIGLDGHIYVDLDDIPEKLCNETTEKLLIERLGRVIDEEFCD